MKNKNITYNLLNFILVGFALFYVVPMFMSITIYDNTLYDLYTTFSLIIMILTFITFFIINLVLGISNIRKKNKAIGVLSIVSGSLALGNIILLYIYDESFDDVWGYLLFIVLATQIILSIINLVLNRKKENTNFNKFHLIVFFFVLLMSIFLIVAPRVLLKENEKRLAEAYNILVNKGKTQLFIDSNSNFYDSTGKLVANNDFDVVKVQKADRSGTYFICVKDKNDELWIVDYSGTKLVRLYDTFAESDTYLIYSLCTMADFYSISSDTNENGIKYLTSQSITDNLLVFANENNDILIEVEIDLTQREDDSSFLELLEEYYTDDTGEYINDFDLTPNLESIYSYKKNYYLTFKNNERIKLDCNNLLIDYNSNGDNYILLMYNNWNIPFYDETESGYFNLEGQKYTISDKNTIVYNTFDNYIIMHNTLHDFNYISTLDFKEQQKVYSLTHCSEDYVLSKTNLYTIKDNKIIETIDNVKYTINIGSDSSNDSFGSVYNYYIY